MKPREKVVKAEIRITLKPKVQDPEGIAIKDALNSLNFPVDIEDVRVGKVISIRLKVNQEIKEVRKILEDMCNKLLANPVIEDYQIVV
jgi:phosphoribosylformylglycinamidine synthase